MEGREVIERVWDAPIALIWELWTTAEGRAAWWGPPGFTVEVHALELRVGGAFTYTMRATSPEMVAAMESSGRPVSHGMTATFTVVEPPHRLTYESPWGEDKLITAVEFTEVPEGVKMVLTLDATQPQLTGGAIKGWRGSIERFATVLGTR